MNDILESDGSWLHKLNGLRFIHVLKLSSCGLTFLPQTLPNSSFSSLLVLDLSDNEFFSYTIPELLYRITSLQYIDLAFSFLQGTISHDIGALSSLECLDLRRNNFEGLIPVEIGNLSNLLTLDLSRNSLVMALDAKGPGSCCKLRKLYLDGVQTQPDVRLNGVGGFWSRCKTNSLEVLSFSNSPFFYNLPDWLWGLQNLNSLTLQDNFFSGSIPAGIGNLTSLECLDLSDNELDGSIDKAIGNLSKLETLCLDNNYLKGVLTESHFSQLVHLKQLFVHGNSLVVDVSSKWLPPFQLEYIDMSGCPLGPIFPPWLQGQKKLVGLYMSSSLIGNWPDWFWSLVSATNNNLTGDSLSSSSFHDIKKVPTSNIVYLDLSNNSFSGTLPEYFAEAMPNLLELHLSKNNFTGNIPHSLCDLSMLILDLSENNLSGDIPNCWNKTSELTAVNFRDNHLSGEFPCSFCSSNSVEFIQLNDNNLSGKLPHCLKKCSNIFALDVGNNRLTGSIPRWFVESFPYIMTLILRSNSLIGGIPPQISFLKNLRILDLSGNNLSGEIPSSIGNLTGMNSRVYIIGGTIGSDVSNGFYNSVGLDSKGSYLYYGFFQAEHVAGIDLSCNKLSGDIPIELTSITSLQILNLSNNHLGGEITSKIGELKNLETLDLSRNQLTGPIPYSLSNLLFLSHFNLSYNLLSGRIPTGPQLKTLTDPSIYEGNLNLCGPPLNNSCELSSMEPPSPNYDSNQSEGDYIWHLGSMGFGFAAGMLGFCGFILYKSKWSDEYLHFLDVLLYKISSSG
jgi:Leucine-rich repeat (LRR) protein